MPASSPRPLGEGKGEGITSVKTPATTMTHFQNALNFLYSFVSYEQKIHWDYNNKTLNLDRFRLFLAHIGNPQDQLKVIHVAGSDGKGSVCAIVSTVLREMGYKTGLYISPHLEDIRERIQINGEWISEVAFCHWAAYLQDKLALHPPVQTGYATFFELMTAMAFLHFQNEKVDFAVIETGLGGRLDATNVMTPLVTVITHISKEHTAQLGDTLEQIADEKLGITRPSVPVVIGHQDDDLLPHFHCRLKDHTIPPVFVDERYEWNTISLDSHIRIMEIGRVQHPEKRKFAFPLLGQYQLQNAAAAIATLDLLHRENHVPLISEPLLQSAMPAVCWPGRFECIQLPDAPLIIFDVAHTVKGAASMRLSLDELFPDRRFWFVMGFLAGKKVKEIVSTVIHPGDILVLTKAPSPRGMAIDEIEIEIAGTISNCQIRERMDDPYQAFMFAVRHAQINDIVVVSGSLYVVGDIRKNLML